MAHLPKKKPKPRKCPICGRPAAEGFKPFCSKRCVDADLARWLKGAYAIPGAPVSDEVEAESESELPKKPQ